MKKILFSLIVIALFSMCSKETKFEDNNTLGIDYILINKSFLRINEYINIANI